MTAMGRTRTFALAASDTLIVTTKLAEVRLLAQAVGHANAPCSLSRSAEKALKPATHVRSVAGPYRDCDAVVQDQDGRSRGGMLDGAHGAGPDEVRPVDAHEHRGIDPLLN